MYSTREDAPERNSHGQKIIGLARMDRVIMTLDYE